MKDTSEAEYILDLCLDQYPGSSLFRYFQGRIHRANSDLANAQIQYEIAYNRNIVGRIEGPFIELLVYELGWVHTVKREPEIASFYLSYLTSRSNSLMKTLYLYLYAINRYEAIRTEFFKGGKSCEELMDNFVDMICAFEKLNPTGFNGNEVPIERYSMQRSGQLLKILKEDFKISINEEKVKNIKKGTKLNTKGLHTFDWIHRASEANGEHAHYVVNIPDSVNKQELFTAILTAFYFPTLEISYFWNALLQLNEDQTERTIEGIHELNQLLHQFVPSIQAANKGVSHLLLGVLQTNLGESSLAIESYSKAILAAKSLTENKWVLPFSYFQRGLTYAHLNLLVNATKDYKLADENATIDFPLINRLRFRSRIGKKELNKRIRLHNSSLGSQSTDPEEKNDF